MNEDHAEAIRRNMRAYEAEIEAENAKYGPPPAPGVPRRWDLDWERERWDAFTPPPEEQG